MTVTLPAPRLSADVLDLADLILVLAVNPGWSGQSLAANTRSRAEELPAGVRTSLCGSAIVDRVDPARNLDLPTRELGQTFPEPAASTPARTAQ